MNTIALACLILAPACSQERTCTKLGTAIEWEEGVDAAAAKARKEGKLVLVLHVAGHFDRPSLT